MKSKALDPIQALSSRACASIGGSATVQQPACAAAGIRGSQRPFCMLCIHCPKCVDNPHTVICDLCAACRVCELHNRAD